MTEKAFKAGHFGKRSGAGFYDWSPGKVNEIPMEAGADFDPIRVLAIGVNECAKLMETESTTKEEIDKGVLDRLELSHEASYEWLIVSVWIRLSAELRPSVCSL